MRDTSDRLRPVVVETRRGPEQLVRILETLARVELTDGLPLADLIGETASRMPRDARSWPAALGHRRGGRGLGNLGARAWPFPRS